MTVKDGKIVRMTLEEAYVRWLNTDECEICDFYLYLSRLRDAGTVVEENIVIKK